MYFLLGPFLTHKSVAEAEGMWENGGWRDVHRAESRPEFGLLSHDRNNPDTTGKVRCGGETPAVS